MKQKSKRIVYKLDIENIKELILQDNTITYFDGNVNTLKFNNDQEAYHEFEILLDAIRDEKKYALLSTIKKINDIDYYMLIQK